MRGAIVDLGGRMPEKVTAVISCMTDAERPFTLAASFVLNRLHRDSKYADHNNRSKHSNVKRRFPRWRLSVAPRIEATAKP